MKKLRTRTEIATAINFGKYPVLTLDLANKTEYGYPGCKVNVDYEDGSPKERAQLYVYADTREFSINSFGCSLSNRFTYSDLQEMLDYANAPTIKADQEILIQVFDSRTKQAYPTYVLTTGTTRKYCQTPIAMEPVKLAEYQIDENDRKWANIAAGARG